jgi:hypothetical protein
MNFERLRELSGLTEDIYKNNSKEEYYSFLEPPRENNADKLASIVGVTPGEIKYAKRIIGMRRFLNGDYIKAVINSRSYIENKIKEKVDDKKDKKLNKNVNKETEKEIDVKLYKKAYEKEMHFDKATSVKDFYDVHKEYRYFGLPELSSKEGREESKQKELETGTLNPVPMLNREAAIQAKHAERIISTVAKGLSFQYHKYNHADDRMKSIPSGKYSIFQNLGNIRYGAVFNYDQGVINFVTFIYADPITYKPSSDNDYKIDLNDISKVDFKFLKI